MRKINEFLKKILSKAQHNESKILEILTLTCTIVTFVTSIFLSIKTHLKHPLLMIVVAVIMGIMIVAILHSKTQKTKDEIDNYYNAAKEIIIKIENNKNNSSSCNNTDKDSIDILGLMLLNMKEIKEYYVLSKTMAKRSFLLAVIMCILGFGIISTSIVAVFIIDISFTQLIIPIIGGAIVEVIAGTSLVVYKKSLEQLNQYYESLHNNERFLSLVNLVDKLSTDKRDETYINIINSQLEALKKY